MRRQWDGAEIRGGAAVDGAGWGGTFVVIISMDNWIFSTLSAVGPMPIDDG